MTKEGNTNEVDENIPSGDIPGIGLWITSIWKLCRSLALTIAGCTLVYLVCKWLMGK